LSDERRGPYRVSQKPARWLLEKGATVVSKYGDQYVCLSVREDVPGTTRAILIEFFVHVSYVRGSVLLQHVDDRPHRLSAGRG